MGVCGSVLPDPPCVTTRVFMPTIVQICTSSPAVTLLNAIACDNAGPHALNRKANAAIQVQNMRCLTVLCILQL
jgi:hypothetical protein